MRITLLDDFIKSCQANKDVVPMFSFMDSAIQQTTPVAHYWDAWSTAPRHSLPNRELEWVDRAFCLFSEDSLTEGVHTFAADVDQTTADAHLWFNKFQWTLEGALVFEECPTAFDVIPIARERAQKSVCLPDIQLHFTKTDDGWSWQQARTGPVNYTFHLVFTTDLTDEEKVRVQEGVDHMGRLMGLYLGSYLQWLEQPGSWEIIPARAPRLKIRDGKVRKIYREGSVGYKTYQMKEPTDG